MPLKYIQKRIPAVTYSQNTGIIVQFNQNKTILAKSETLIEAFFSPFVTANNMKWSFWKTWKTFLSARPGSETYWELKESLPY